MTAVTDGSVNGTGVAAFGCNCQFGASTQRPSGTALSDARGWTAIGQVGETSDGSSARTCTLNWAPTKLTTDDICAAPSRNCDTASPW